MLKKRLSTIILMVGVLIVIITPFATVSYSREGRMLLYKIPMEVGSEEASVLEFRVEDSKPSLVLRIHLEVNATIVPPGKQIYPLLDIVLVDQLGMSMLEKNQAPSYMYMRARAIENSTSFTVRNINRTGEYYLILSNRIPEKANIHVTMLEEWDKWSVNQALYPTLGMGIFIVALGIILRRLHKGT